MMLLLFRLELFLYLVYVPTISFMITPKVVYFLHQSLAVGNILIVEVLRSNYHYHYLDSDASEIRIDIVCGVAWEPEGSACGVFNNCYFGLTFNAAMSSRLSKN